MSLRNRFRPVAAIRSSMAARSVTRRYGLRMARAEVGMRATSNASAVAHDLLKLAS